MERRSKILQQRNQGEKHVLTDIGNNDRSTKKLKTSANDSGSSILSGISRQALDKKQVVKNKRSKVSGLSQGTQMKYGHIKSKIDTNQNNYSAKAPGDQNNSRSSRSLHRNSIDRHGTKALDVEREESSIHHYQDNSIIKKSLNARNDSGIDIGVENMVPSPIVTQKDSKTHTILLKTSSVQKSIIVKQFNQETKVHRPLKAKRLMPYFDPCLVEEYEEEIYSYMRMMELQTMPLVNYITRQPEMDWSMRNQLVSWLVEVHFQFKLLPETLYLAVNLVDRTLGARPISVSKLQLVGVTSLLIASKYEEIMSPSVNDLEYITDNAYTTDEIIRAERYLLGIVKYRVFSDINLDWIRESAQLFEKSIEIKSRQESRATLLLPLGSCNDGPSVFCLSAFSICRCSFIPGHQVNL